MLICLQISAQQPFCKNNLRYQDFCLGEPSFILDIPYREAPGLSGRLQKLSLDVFLPNETPGKYLRPLIIFVHGGGFIGGRKDGMHGLCKDFSKMGYVTASIDYRLLDSLFINDELYIRGVMLAAEDVLYSMKFFQNHAEGVNDFLIDTNQIYLAGVSAGAILVQHINFIDSIQQVISHDIDKIKSRHHLLGELKPKACVAYSGALLSTAIIDEDDGPIISFHEIEDPVVPCERSKGRNPLFNQNISGSCAIHQKLSQFDSFRHEFYTFSNGKHLDYLKEEKPVVLKKTATFLKNQLCEQQNLNSTFDLMIQYGTNSFEQNYIIHMECNEDDELRFELSNTCGISVLNQRYRNFQNVRFSSAHLPSGIYYGKVNNSKTIERFIIEVRH